MSEIFKAPDVPEPSGELNKVDDTFQAAQRMAFVGAGAGGCRIADAFYQIGYRRVFCINTTEKDMLDLQCPNRLILKTGQEGGAGKDPEKGRAAVEENFGTVVDKMRDFWGDQIDRIFICLGAGGGTGTGAAMPLIKAAQKYADTIGIEGGSENKIGVNMYDTDRTMIFIGSKDWYRCPVVATHYYR